MILPAQLKRQLANKKQIRAIVLSENTLGEITAIESVPIDFLYFNVGLLQIRFTEDSNVELFVKATHSPKYLETPTPVRQAHKISILEPGKPVHYRTNYKYECEGTRWPQRSYLEYDCVIENLSAVEEILFTLDKIQAVDLKHAKVIDERRILK